MTDKKEETKYIMGEVPTQYGISAVDSKTKTAATDLQLLIEIANSIEKIKEDIQEIKKNLLSE